MHRAYFGALVALAATSGTHAADMPYKSPPAAASEPGAVQWEFGTRVWYSTGKNKQDLLNFAGTFLASRLTYADLGATTGEAFFRADDRWSGLFLKGYVGAGSVFRGHLTDEDFPPVSPIYSSTNSA
jgi:hypothetical protein